MQRGQQGFELGAATVNVMLTLAMLIAAGGISVVITYPRVAVVPLVIALGVVAIVFAAQVNGKVASGDVAGAMDSSKKAKTFSFIAIGLGVLAGVIYFIFILLGVGLSALGGR